MESRAPCREEVGKRLRMKALQRQKRSQVWCYAMRGVRKSLHEVWDLWSKPGNVDERKEVERASRQLVLHDSNSKIRYSQASRQENVPQTTRKLLLKDQNLTQSDERKYSNSTSSRKLASSPELKITECTNHQDMSKIFQCLRKKLGMSAMNATFSMEAYKTNVLIWRMFVTSSMKAAIHLGPDYMSNSEICKNTKFEDTESVFDITHQL